MQTLGELLRDKRKAIKGLTTTILARDPKVNIAQAYYSRIENDSRLPSREAFNRINKYFGDSLRLELIYRLHASYTAKKGKSYKDHVNKIRLMNEEDVITDYLKDLLWNFPENLKPIIKKLISEYAPSEKDNQNLINEKYKIFLNKAKLIDEAYNQADSEILKFTKELTHSKFK